MTNYTVVASYIKRICLPLGGSSTVTVNGHTIKVTAGSSAKCSLWNLIITIYLDGENLGTYCVASNVGSSGDYQTKWGFDGVEYEGVGCPANSIIIDGITISKKGTVQKCINNPIYFLNKFCYSIIGSNVEVVADFNATPGTAKYCIIYKIDNNPPIVKECKVIPVNSRYAFVSTIPLPSKEHSLSVGAGYMGVNSPDSYIIHSTKILYNVQSPPRKWCSDGTENCLWYAMETSQDLISVWKKFFPNKSVPSAVKIQSSITGNQRNTQNLLNAFGVTVVNAQKTYPHSASQACSIDSFRR